MLYSFSRPPFPLGPLPSSTRPRALRVPRGSKHTTSSTIPFCCDFSTHDSCLSEHKYPHASKLSSRLHPELTQPLPPALRRNLSWWFYASAITRQAPCRQYGGQCRLQ